MPSPSSLFSETSIWTGWNAPLTDHVMKCNEMRCVNFTKSRESAHSYGRNIVCRSSYRKLSEAVTRPHAQISPFWSRKGFRRFWLKQRYSSEKYLSWVQIVMSRSVASTSLASRRIPESGDCLRHRWINRWTYARTRNALSNLEMRSRKSSVGINATWALTAPLSISVAGRSVPWLGHWTRGQVGPCHQSGLSTSSWRGTPRLAKSAGLCSDWTCDQLAASVDSVIFVTLVAIGVEWERRYR